jgi:hypothetical protein
MYSIGKALHISHFTDRIARYVTSRFTELCYNRQFSFAPTRGTMINVSSLYSSKQTGKFDSFARQVVGEHP